ncbi:MAG: hypothetical protein KVP17_002032 [Porospora cf. gigantea B]|uniref:uncharacterized protein n=1 Tax=Porospora cf. gigantea B TaxID=2853592 RepID=UPI003571CBB5|nr:MAG: hypothetical protein KVP17_002032 [Porospora cf. gigantea B]
MRLQHEFSRIGVSHTLFAALATTGALQSCGLPSEKVFTEPSAEPEIGEWRGFDNSVMAYHGRVRVSLPDGSAKWTKTRLTCDPLVPWAVDPSVVLNNEDFALPADNLKQYRFLTVNGLRVMLVEDSRVTKDAVAVHLQVGHMLSSEFSPGLCGLARRCLGHTDVGSLQSWVEDHQGEYTQCTDLQSTCIEMRLQRDFFRQGFAMLGRCLSSPNITEATVATEFEAHEPRAEMARDLEGLLPVARLLGGDVLGGSVRRVERREPLVVQVRDWCNRYVSRNLMCCAVVSSKPLDEQQALVEDCLAGVPLKSENSQSGPPPGDSESGPPPGDYQSGPPPGDSQSGTLQGNDSPGRFMKVCLPGDRSHHAMFLFPVLSNRQPLWNADASLLFAQLDPVRMGNELTPWASEVNVSVPAAAGARFLKVNLQLTDKGTSNEGLREAGMVLAQMIRRMKLARPENVLDSITARRHEAFNSSGTAPSADALMYVRDLQAQGPDMCTGLQHLAPLSNTSDLLAFIEAVDIEKVMLLVSGPCWDEECADSAELDLKCHISPIPSDWMDDWRMTVGAPARSAVPALRPGRKAPTDKNDDLPKVLDAGRNCYCIYKKDDWFGSRLMFASFQLFVASSLCVATKDNQARRTRGCLSMLAALVAETLERLMPEDIMKDVGLSVFHVVDHSVLLLNATGNPDKIPAALEQAKRALQNPLKHVSQARFEACKSRLVSQTEDHTNTPMTAGLQMQRRASFPDSASIEDVREMLSLVTWTDFSELFKEGFESAAVVGAVMGNATEKEAQAVLQLASASLKPALTPDVPSFWMNDNVILLDTTPDILSEETVIHCSIREKNCGLQHRILLSLYSVWAESALFKQLREAEDLVYVASAESAFTVDGSLLQITLATSKDASLMLDRLQRFIAELQPPTAAEFSDLVGALRHNLANRPRSMLQEARQSWTQLTTGQPGFISTRNLMGALEEVTCEQLQTFVKERASKSQVVSIATPLKKSVELLSVKRQGFTIVHVPDTQNEAQVRCKSKDLSTESEVDTVYKYLNSLPGIEHTRTHSDCVSHNVTEIQQGIALLK